MANKLVSINGQIPVVNGKGIGVQVIEKEEQSKTLTLGASAPSTVTPDSGKVLSSVPVVLDTSVVKAENIKKDVQILGVTGTHEGGGGGGHVVTCDYVIVDSSVGFIKFLKSDGTLITYNDYTMIANVSESDVIAIFVTCQRSYAYVVAESDNATFSYIMQIKNSQSTGSSNRISGDEYVTLIVLLSEDTHFTSLTSIR